MSGTSLLLTVLAVAGGLSAAMALAFLIAHRTRNSGWVDAVWTFAVGTVASVGALAPIGGHSSPGARQWLVSALVVLWSLRLGLHIVRRSAGKPDDPRYAKLQRDWGPEAARRMFALLQKQALVTIPLVMSIVLAAHNPAPLRCVTDTLAVGLFLLAVAGAWLADAQLRRFLTAQTSHNAICDRGLWRWSRHPNYFFEWLGWLAYPVLAIGFHGYPWGYLALLGPAVMYWLLVHVSGIPPLEDHMRATRGAAFNAHAARTNAFFPWPRAIG